MHFALTAHPEKSAARAVLLRLLELISARGELASIDQRWASVAPGVTPVDIHHLPKDIDVILCVGGDGTLISTARKTLTAQRPILGINLGRLGFLTDTEPGDLEEALSDLSEGRYHIDERLTMETEFSIGLTSAGSVCLNDLVIQRAGAGALIPIEVSVDGTLLHTYEADGIIVSTPTGSTAYSLSLGGPIMMPSSAAFLLSPIAPHVLTVRPMVIPATATITARVPATDSHLVILADGQAFPVANEAVQVNLRRGALPVRLVRRADQHFFDTLRNKLLWGAHSRNQART